MMTAVAVLMLCVIVGALSLSVAMRIERAMRQADDAQDVWSDDDLRARVLKARGRHRWEEQ